MIKSLLEKLQNIRSYYIADQNYFLTVMLLGFVLLFGNNSVLYDQDEAAYAGFSRVMLETKNFISMEFPFSEPHRKPPLHFWLTSFIFYIFGEKEFYLRLLPSLWIFLSCILTYFLAKKILKDKKKAQLSFFILSFSLYFPLNGKIALVDSLLTFMSVWSFYLLFLYFFEENNKVLFYIWLPISLAALTKGPPIYIFIIGVLGLSVFHPYFRKKVLRLGIFVNLLFSTLPLVLWGYLAWEKTNGELIRWMINWYILRRATNPVFGQSGPPGYYLLIFFITLFPWSIYVPKLLKDLYFEIQSLFQSIRNQELKNYDPINYFLLSAFLVSWVFYEFMMSKLPSYVLASYPIFSILLSRLWLEKSAQTIKKLVFFNLLLIIVIQIAIFLFEEKRKDTFQTALKWKQILSKEEILYFDKDYGIPSLAFYLKYPQQKIVVLKNLFELKNLASGSKVALDENGLILLQNLHKIKILDQRNLFLYDRWKNLQLFLVQLE